jgi:hypothetical protein
VVVNKEEEGENESKDEIRNAKEELYNKKKINFAKT